MDQFPIKRISIQVALDGYSFKVQEGDGIASMSGWNNLDAVVEELSGMTGGVSSAFSVLTPKVSLVPSSFLNPDDSREMLQRTVDLDSTDSVEAIEVPEFSAVLLYSLSAYEDSLSRTQKTLDLRPDGPALPEMYFILQDLLHTDGYNKIVASYADFHLHLAIAQGKNLLLCNVYDAADFTTAEYFIFLAMRKLQLNPEVSAICFRTPLSEAETMSLYRYFKGVERI